MKKNLYLHIGCQKTGSTAIQDFLTINQKEMQKQGFKTTNNPQLKYHPEFLKGKLAGYQSQINSFKQHQKITFKSIRHWLIQINFKKEKKIIRLFGIYILNLKN